MPKKETVLSLEEAIKQGFNPDKCGYKPIIFEVGGNNIIIGFEDKRFAKYEIVVHKIEDEETGKIIMYDKIVATEGPADSEGKRTYISGNIIVPYYIDKKDKFYIGLIEQYRANPFNFETKSFGIKKLEVPMGFVKQNESIEQGAKREVEEEFLREVLGIKYLGVINANPARFTNSLAVYAAEVNPNETINVKEDEGELITKRRFFNEKELEELIKNNEIINGLSLAALKIFDSYKKDMLRQHKEREKNEKYKIWVKILNEVGWPFPKW